MCLNAVTASNSAGRVAGCARGVAGARWPCRGRAHRATRLCLRRCGSALAVHLCINRYLRRPCEGDKLRTPEGVREERLDWLVTTRGSERRERRKKKSEKEKSRRHKGKSFKKIGNDCQRPLGTLSSTLRLQCKVLYAKTRYWEEKKFPISGKTHTSKEWHFCALLSAEIKRHLPFEINNSKGIRQSAI